MVYKTKTKYSVNCNDFLSVINYANTKKVHATRNYQNKNKNFISIANTIVKIVFGLTKSNQNNNICAYFLFV